MLKYIFPLTYLCMHYSIYRTETRQLLANAMYHITTHITLQNDSFSHQ